MIHSLKKSDTMKKEPKEIKWNPSKLNNGKYYTKANNIYIGCFNEKELNRIKKEMELLCEVMKPNEIIKHFRTLYIDIEKSYKISQGMQQAKYKQYNKKLEIKTIEKIKRMAKHYNKTENETLTLLINEKYESIF